MVVDLLGEVLTQRDRDVVLLAEATTMDALSILASEFSLKVRNMVNFLIDGAAHMMEPLHDTEDEIPGPGIKDEPKLAWTILGLGQALNCLGEFIASVD